MQLPALALRLTDQPLPLLPDFMTMSDSSGGTVVAGTFRRRLRRTADWQPARAWFAALGAGWVFVLVLLGAFTTSIGAGMIFPDWPLSNGSINPDGWLTDVAMFAEHSHRLSAGLMAALTLVIAVWVWCTDARAWLRWLAVAAFALVMAQALLGGLRVLLDHLHIESIETSVGRLFAMGHAVLAQVFVCALIAIALSLSRPWMERKRGGGGGGRGSPARARSVACCSSCS